jgi:hypothetical protein
MAGLPLEDPQFWAVTGAALAAVLLLVLRAWRRRRASAEAPASCAHCEQATRHVSESQRGGE